MDFEGLKQFCLGLPRATMDFPFDAFTAAFRIEGGIFALCSQERLPLAVNLKGDPALNRDLRASYRAVEPGWHMNKEHWNTVTLNQDVEEQLLFSLIRHSYDLVLARRNKGRNAHSAP